MSAPSKAERLTAARAERTEASRAWDEAARAYTMAYRARDEAFLAYAHAVQGVRVIEAEP